jgi:hypothetical protein
MNLFTIEFTIRFTIIQFQGEDPSLGTRVPPTIIEAGASVGHLTIVYASADILANADDRCTLSPHSVVKSGAILVL